MSTNNYLFKLSCSSISTDVEEGEGDMEGRGDSGVIEAERGIELKMDALLESSLGVNIIGDKDNGLFIKESI